MKKILVLTLVVVLASSCSSLLPGQAPASSVDTQATIDSIVHTAAAQTLAAQPSPTTVPPTKTDTPVVVASSPTTEATIEAPSSTPVPNLTTTPVTATVGTIIGTITITVTKPASTSSGKPTLTPTLGILTYGTLPPAVPYAIVTIFNKSEAQAYISLQNDATDRPDAVLEYPVKKEVRAKAPLGYYQYVVWVGGRKITGEFFLNKNEDRTITIFKDKVVVQ